MASADGRLRRWGRRGLFWLPILILLAVIGATTAAAADLAPPPAGTPAVQGPRPKVPVLDLRRDLDPLADQAADRQLRAALDAYVATLPPDTCLVVHADGVDYRHRADDPQAPASVQKLLTAVAVLTALGPDHHLRTTVTGPAPVDGVVAGDVFLVGGGDPLLAVPAYAAHFDDQPQPFTDLTVLADRVVAAGVRRVEGAVVGDDSRYDQQRYHPSWPPRFATQGQTGPLSALTVNDAFERWPAQGLRPVTPAADPARQAATVFAGLLAERGVDVAGGAASGTAPAELPELAALESPPLRVIVAEMLRESDNGTAELLLRELGLQVNGAGTFPAGTAAVRSVLTEAGYDLTGVDPVDGSGLSADDRVTCELVSELLARPPTAALLRDGLAVAGETGTLADRWDGSPLDGRVRAKTGTLNQVTALAGFVRTQVGDRARFALIVNVGDRIEPETVEAQRQLVELLVDHPRRPDVSRFRPSASGPS